LEFKDLSVLFFVTTFVFIVLSAYFSYLLWAKKKNGNTLNDNLKHLENQLVEKTKILQKINGESADAQAKLKHLLDLESNEQQLRSDVNILTDQSQKITDEINKLKAEKDELSEKLIGVKSDISIFEPTISLINVGFFEEPKYLFETSDRFKEEIKQVREEQKKMIKEKTCVEIPENIAITSDSKYAAKILNGQAELMIKAFNIECDNLMSMLKPSNYANILDRIDKEATDIEKSVISLQCGFSKQYINLKFKECELQYQFKLKQAREKEEQDIIKENMREEQKALREYERALAKAEKEEEMYKTALETARKEMAIVSEKDRQKLEDRILFLQEQLTKAEEIHKRAQSMAEQTRRGHVYVISNIGSFGTDVYKIGLTRRLEPLDRVKELSDASVPFDYDVHAIIYNEDAPSLERALHNEFSRFRVNQVNLRKEFFKINLLEIQEKAKNLTKGEFEFKVTALAEEYYESLKLRPKEDIVQNN
jgi:Domain of unknown function (DUF4041)/Meiotically up-regulated gene 113